MTQEVVASVYDAPSLGHLSEEVDNQTPKARQDSEISKVSMPAPAPLDDDLLAHVFASVPITTTAGMQSPEVVTVAKPDEYQQYDLHTETHQDVSTFLVFFHG